MAIDTKQVVQISAYPYTYASGTDPWAGARDRGPDDRILEKRCP
jgi:hypothetical protein